MALKNNVIKILLAVKVSHNDVNQTVRPMRLGKFNGKSSKSRPIRITLCNENLVHKCVKASKILRSNPQFANIRVAFDRTPRQTQYYKELQQQLSERTQAGESNLIIKIFSGMPKRVTNLNYKFRLLKMLRFTTRMLGGYERRRQTSIIFWPLVMNWTYCV